MQDTSLAVLKCDGDGVGGAIGVGAWFGLALGLCVRKVGSQIDFDFRPIRE